MAEIKTILFATDFSEGSERACDMARTLAGLADAKLVVLHVITELADKRSRYLPSEVIDTVIREVERHAVEDMRTFCSKHFAGLDTATEIVVGKGADAILAQADKLDADLIVMGTHGRTGIEKLVVGSTAEKVVRGARIPVLTVRE
ncbi:MAG TPA: universal stress protein [Rhodocyclaceae bacterium]|nr:universal stress protein [Rhodocyclaceae bacterium]